ncbi:uncharacterized protein ACLA_052550 [Aspergillus clavatus NRRL 1]|uniref:Uncharacterized protein n=1 Tax=Aspergillus clavatus (strain ATCC 1007 / CBS 513.65 / DSM 816 / NCTC 3887 / NRRL 1 / QM 1276 / 107) TaxID=344612 RepID=A1CIS7_ASPCL|nr:uncharacterized protein ACLA_052550 [Aspergillus clavatus NRRL 1]EAW10782.1 hypothetical protein ACLA_052550 [Aspergillus clavatus NRRL 1]
MVPPEDQREATYNHLSVVTHWEGILSHSTQDWERSRAGGRGTSFANYPTASLLIGPRLTQPRYMAPDGEQ